MRTWVVVMVLLSASLAVAKGEGGSDGTGFGGSVRANGGFRAVTTDVIGGPVDASQLDTALNDPAVTVPLAQCYGTEKMLAWIEIRNGSVKTVNVGGAKVAALESCIAKALKKTKLTTKERVVATLHIDPIPLPPPMPRHVVTVAIDVHKRDGASAGGEATRVVKMRSGIYRACYQKELYRQPGIKGRLTVKFKVSKDGAVSEPTVVASALGSDDVGACVAANVLRLTFPAGHDDELTVAFDFAEI